MLTLRQAVCIVYADFLDGPCCAAVLRMRQRPCRPEQGIFHATHPLLQTVTALLLHAGILDQGSGCLEVFDEIPEGKAYPCAVDVVQNMGTVVDALFARSQKLVA